jgi:hypothetical protein
MNILHKPLPRRTILKSSGVALGLPFLEAMHPLHAQAPQDIPRRMVAINTNLGIMSEHFFPSQAGKGYQLSTYLESMSRHRDDFTVFSGVSHPGVTGGHSAEVSYLTAAQHPGTASFRNSISLDQYAAQYMGDRTRVPALALNVSKKGNQSLSFTNSGVMLPAENNPVAVYRALFVKGSEKDIERKMHEIRLGRSILDVVANRASELKKKLGKADKERMDQYFTSVREVERRLEAAGEWEQKPKPKVDAPPPKDSEYLLEKIASMYSLIQLALETDSTRLVTLLIKLDGFSAHIPGVSTEAHNLSHHVSRPEKKKELKNLETAEFKELALLLDGLSSIKEGGESLLDRTMVLYGSNLGNGNNHDTKNLPILLAGGGFKHGNHLAFDPKDNHPLPNLFVSMLQRMGVETGSFASSTGTMKGMEFA